jgi:hypothetical protein
MHKAGAIAVVESTADAPPLSSLRRPDARFLTQLIATRHGLMQTRAKKRTAPELGAAAYDRSGRRADMSENLDLKL